MIINKALLKHGYSKFKLEILEYCNPKDLVEREQHYRDILKPEYNMLNTAYSSLGYKHTKESLHSTPRLLSTQSLKEHPSCFSCKRKDAAPHAKARSGQGGCCYAFPLHSFKE